ncbi:hypothetical protein PTTG_08521 [Puccinia triticina 1-1 BBBD Race 1]|uniref:histone acetyltransferase n=1 Tax=Puccinia triticina (isolate 1-1 / race 1 (BBBD)) TaxID=630390 RepID=A0A180H047_PUCT1|nr:hypothetical protein PTTG_08521 [Puccinia triticina 1-1 BBBD Race 1]
MLATNPGQPSKPRAADQPPSEKRRRTGKDTTSHGPTLEVALVDIDLVVFGRYEIKAWFPSPYVIDQLEYRQATSAAKPPPQPEPATLRLKRQSNGRFLKKQPKSSRPTRHTHAFQEHPPDTLPTSPSHSTPPPETHDDDHRIQKHNRSPSPDSLSSLQSTSSPPSNHSDLHHPNHLLPVPPNHLYPSPQSHPSSLTSDPGPTTSHPASNHLLPHSRPPPALKLYVCDGCLKYLFSSESYLQHKMRCEATHPPGRKVYQSGKLIIREVDGSSAKLYCQCLCLFGKLFIDHKYIFFDVEGFKFYVLTEAGDEAGGRETIVGFFSKEKISYDGYNLACIVTLPPFQNKGHGTLLIEFSYELDRIEAEKGAGVFLEHSHKQVLGTPERPLSALGARGYLRFWTAVLVRFFRTLFTPPAPRAATKPSARRAAPPAETPIAISLEHISRSTRLRPDDVAFALVSSGLAVPKPRPAATRSTTPVSEEDEEEAFVITPRLVERVARKANVRRALLDPRHVLLNRPASPTPRDPSAAPAADNCSPPSDSSVHSLPPAPVCPSPRPTFLRTHT